MAYFIPANGPVQAKIETPLTLTLFRAYVGDKIEFIELLSGDILIVNPEGQQLNSNANGFIGSQGPVMGDAVLCTPEEIA